MSDAYVVGFKGVLFIGFEVATIFFYCTFSEAGGAAAETAADYGTAF